MTSEKQFDYPDAPTLECDLIMKGGITSGVIYPLAVCRLAETYRLKSVGGASAGAIAAAVTAAAELGRVSGGGFDVVADLPKWLASNGPNGRSNLFNLFQPQPRCRGLFRLGTAWVGMRGAGRFRLATALVSAALRGFWLAALIGALPGIALLIAVVLTTNGAGMLAGTVAALIVILIGTVAGIASGVARTVHRGVADNMFGMCTGMSTDAAIPAVTPWLHERIQSAAGRDVDAAAVTFADLWGNTTKPDDPEVDLAIMTTNLTERRPQRLPWEDEDERLYFDVADMRRLLPPKVAEQISIERAANDDPDGREMFLMPPAGQIPILLATRMSLSFPILLSAVRLYAFDGARYTPVWFTDGGACSNFPVHFFDAPLPRRPTFALNLARFAEDSDERDAESENIVLLDNNAAQLPWPRHDIAPSSLGGVAKFLGSIVGTARGWVDGSALSMPGYRDRIVTVNLTSKQGGMNLEMDSEVITRLTDRGLAVGDLLVQRFAGESPGQTKAPGWENQRWVRYHAAIAATESWLERFHDVYTNSERPYQTPYSDWLDGAPPDEFPWPNSEDATAARTRTGALIRLAESWRNDDNFQFRKTAPKPQPILRSQRRL